MREFVSSAVRVLLTAIALALANGAILLGAGYALVHVVLTSPNPFWVAKEDFYRRAIPDEIGVTSMVHQGSDVSPLLTLAFWIRIEACGGFAFRLSREMVAELREGGIARLQDAKVGRGYIGDHNHTYLPWRPTPLPSQWMGDGRWAGNLGCLIKDDRSFDADAVFDAARKPGSYFTYGSENEVLVIPHLELLVYTYHD